MAAEPSIRRLGPISPPGSGALAPAVALLTVSVVINYIDRSNLSVAGPQLSAELRLSPQQLGLLLSSFFWTYTSLQIVSGWLVDRFNVNLVFAAGFFLWSAATAATGFVHGFALLLAMRLLLGAGESVAFPSYSKILAKYCPETLRGVSNAFISSGIALGPAIGTFFGALLMARYNWRWFFITLGMVSLLWLPLWLKWKPEGPGLVTTATAETAGPSTREILAQRSAWGSFAGLFAYNYHSYFLITWLPSYLEQERGFSMPRMGKIGGGVFLTLAATAMLSGWLSDRWVAAGATPTRARKLFTSLGLAVSSCACICIATFSSNSRLAVLFLFLTAIGAGLCTSNIWAITQTIAGPLGAGKWTGLQNCAGNFAGILAPALTGLVVQRTGHFYWALVAVSVVLLCGSLSWAFVVGRVEAVHWRLGSDGRGAEFLGDTAGDR